MTTTRTERLILTASAATSDKTSSTFVVPLPSAQFILSLDVTVGTGLDLKVTLQIYLEEHETWINSVVCIPAVGITGVSTTPILFGAPAVDSAMAAANVPIRGHLRAIVVHGNSEAATYTLYLKPM